MNTDMIAPLLGFGGVLITSISSSMLIIYRIGQLEKRVDTHNNVIQRTFILEEKVSNLEREVLT